MSSVSSPLKVRPDWLVLPFSTPEEVENFHQKVCVLEGKYRQAETLTKVLLLLTIVGAAIMRRFYRHNPFAVSGMALAGAFVSMMPVFYYFREIRARLEPLEKFTKAAEKAHAIVSSSILEAIQENRITPNLVNVYERRIKYCSHYFYKREDDIFANTQKAKWRDILRTEVERIKAFSSTKKINSHFLFCPLSDAKQAAWILTNPRDLISVDNDGSGTITFSSKTFRV